MARRALIMASGANRGAYYTGFLKAFQTHGITFDLFAGVSAGGISSAWMAAGDADAYIDSWRQADAYRVAVHPLLARGKTRTVDQLLQRITLKTMDLEAAQTSSAEVRMTASQIGPTGRLLSKLRRRVFTNREAKDAREFSLMLRATAFVPLVNGFASAITIRGHRYLDGGLVGRVPLDLAPRDNFDEIWVSACSPNGIRELTDQLQTWNRPERLIVLTPSEDLPVGRWTLEWNRVKQAIELGARDMELTIHRRQACREDIFVGMAAESFRQARQPGRQET